MEKKKKKWVCAINRKERGTTTTITLLPTTSFQANAFCFHTVVKFEDGT